MVECIWKLWYELGTHVPHILDDVWHTFWRMTSDTSNSSIERIQQKIHMHICCCVFECIPGSAMERHKKPFCSTAYGWLVLYQPRQQWYRAELGYNRTTDFWLWPKSQNNSHFIRQFLFRYSASVHSQSGEQNRVETANAERTTTKACATTDWFV